MHKKYLRSFALAGLLLIFSSLLMSVATPLLGSRASAQEYSGDDIVDAFCVPSTNAYGSNDDNRSAGSWLTIRIINRANFEVSISNSACPNDILVGNTRFSTLENLRGIYKDGNLDSNFDYRLQVGDASSDDSTIDQFDGGEIQDHLRDRFGGYRKVVSTSDLEAVLNMNDSGAGMEILLSIEEDAVDGYSCTSHDNGNFVFYNQGGDGLSHRWRCRGQNIQNLKGLIANRRIERSTYANFNITYTYKDEKIVRVDGNESDGSVFSWCGSGSSARYESGDNCNGDWYLDGLGKDDLANSGSTSEVVLKNKDSGDGMTVVIAGGQSESSENVTAPTSAESEDDNSCEAQSGAMGWILCPVVLLLDGILNWLDTQVQSLLEIDESSYTDPRLKRSWSVIRNIAFTILIPVMLVMVIGTALNFDVFSAYTVKKALPRLVIAIVFITLSWYITQFLIGLSNVVGGGVLGILTFPFGEAGNMSLATLFAVSSENGGDLASTAASTATQWTGSTVAVGAVVGGLVLGGGEAVAIALMFLGTAVLFIFSAYLVLVLRELFILALMLAAPLAIIAWIFPGNDKLWKSWWSLFSKLLIMFPLIMALIALGRIMAYLVDAAGGGGAESVLNPILKLTAYVIPFFFIPFTFKFAGGMFATITGAINDRERGLFDRLKKGRQQAGQSLHEGTMKGSNRLGKGRVGSVYRRAGSLGRDGSWGLSKTGRSKWHEANQRRLEKVGDEMLEAGGGRAFNDDDASELLRDADMTKDRFVREYAAKMMSQGRAGTQAEGEEMARRALFRAEQAVGARVGTGTMAVAAQKFRTSMTNSAYASGEEGLGQLQSDLMDLQRRGLITAADAASWMKANKGRSDFASNGFVDTINFAQGRKFNEDGTSTAVSARDQIAGAFHGADPREVVGAHQKALETFSEQAAINLSDAVESGDQGLIDRAMADAANIYDSLSNVSAKKGEEFASSVLSQSSGMTLRRAVIGADGKPTKGADGNIVTEEYDASVRQYIEHLRGDSSRTAFHDRRREYASARDAHAAGAAAEASAPTPE